MKKIVLFTGLIFATLFYTSCEEDNDTVPTVLINTDTTTVVIDTTKKDTVNTDTVIVVLPTPHAKLKGFEEQLNGVYGMGYKFIYENGKLTKIYAGNSAYDSIEVKTHDVFTLTYTGDIIIRLDIDSKVLGTYKTAFEYRYDSLNRINEYDILNNGLVSGTVKLEYDKYNRVVKNGNRANEYADSLATVPSKIGNFEMEYDGKVGIAKAVKTNYLILQMFFKVDGPHNENIVREFLPSNSQASTWSFTYDTDDYPLTRTTGTNGFVRTYFY